MPKDGLGKGEKEAKEIVDWIGAKVAHHKKLRGGVRFVDEASTFRCISRSFGTNVDPDTEVDLRQDLETIAEAEGSRRTGQRCKGEVVDAQYIDLHNPSHHSHLLAHCHLALATRLELSGISSYRDLPLHLQFLNNLLH